MYGNNFHPFSLYSPCDNAEWWMCRKKWNNISYQRIIVKHTYSHLAIVIHTFKKSIHTRCFHPAWWHKRIIAHSISDAINQIFTQAKLNNNSNKNTHTHKSVKRRNSKAWLPSIQINRASKMRWAWWDRKNHTAIKRPKRNKHWQRLVFEWICRTLCVVCVIIRRITIKAIIYHKN